MNARMSISSCPIRPAGPGVTALQHRLPVKPGGQEEKPIPSAAWIGPRRNGGSRSGWPGGGAALRFAGAARRGETVPSPASRPGSSTEPHAGRGVDQVDCSPGEDTEHDPYTLRDLGPGPGLAIGTGPAFLPSLAQAQVPTSQFSPGPTPLSDSRSNHGAPDVAPNPNEPVSRATAARHRAMTAAARTMRGAGRAPAPCGPAPCKGGGSRGIRPG